MISYAFCIPALLIALGLADVNYGDWFKWSEKFRLLNLPITGLILFFGLTVGYGSRMFLTIPFISGIPIVRETLNLPPAADSLTRFVSCSEVSWQ